MQVVKSNHISILASFHQSYDFDSHSSMDFLCVLCRVFGIKMWEMGSGQESGGGGGGGHFYICMIAKRTEDG